VPPLFPERDESTPFRRVLEEVSPLLREEEAARLLGRCPLDGEVDSEAQPLIVSLLAGTGVVLQLLLRLEGLNNGVLVLRFRLLGHKIRGRRLLPQLLL
jgi:hypothetical protein